MTNASSLSRVRARALAAAVGLTALVLPLFGASDANALFGSADTELVSLTASKDPVNVNEPFEYTATVRNNDVGPVTNVHVQLFVSSGLEITSASASVGNCSAPVGGAVDCNLAGMLGLETRTVTLNVVPRANGSQFAVGQVRADEIDPEPNNDKQQFTAVGNSEPDLAVTKTDDADPVQAFDQLTYTLTARNVDNADGNVDNATGVSVVDTLPASVDFVSADSGCTYASGPHAVTCAMGALDEDSSVGKQVRVTPTVPGNITNDATISGAESDPNATNDSATEGTAVTDTTPDLKVEKVDDVDPVTQMSNLTYTLTATNVITADGNPDPATGVEITDTLPGSFDFVSAAEGCTYDEPNHTVTCAIGDLTEGASTTKTLVVKPTTTGTISNTATIAGDQFATDPLGNNSAVQLTEVVAPDLKIAKADSVEPATKDIDFTYTLTVENLANGHSGNQTATGVSISDPLPAELDFVSASDGCTYDQPNHKVSCQVGSLAEGASAQRTITVTPTQAVAISNTATVSSDQNDDPAANNSDTEMTSIDVTRPDLAVTKVESKDPVRENEDLTYTLNARNRANTDDNADPATGVTVTDTLPAAADFISASNGCTYDQPTHTVTCAIGDLAEGALAQKQVMVRVRGASFVVNTASITGDQIAEDGNTSNNSATALTVVNAVTPDLSISKTDDADPVAGDGAPLTYTLAVTNQDNDNALVDNASGVVATDPLPASVNFVSADYGCAYNAGTHTVTCDLGYVDEGVTKTREIAVTTGTGGALSNTATVTGHQTDPVPANDSSTEETVVDTTAPDTQIDSGPADGSTIANSSPQFAFSGNPGADTAKVQCKLDGGAFEDCTSPKVFSGLSEGPHTVAFRAEDAVGNQDAAPAERTFTVDTVAPDTQIDSGPADGSTIANSSPQFAFSGTPGDTAKVQCKLDGGAFEDCTSPKTFSGLGEGPHTVAFRAEDAVGNRDATPATRTFTVDTTPPNTQIDSGPADGSTIATASPEFAFSGTPGDTAKVQCKLDGGAFEDCTSPKVFSGLSEGAHTVVFRAEDAVGNQDATPAERTFTVDTTVPDTTPPDTQIDAGPADGSTITTEEATFSFSGTPGADTSKIQCKLDDGAFENCSSPKTFSGLSEGSHTVAFRAEDAVGNQDATPAERTFTVDTIAPDTQIDSGPADGSTVTTTEATFTFSGAPAGDTAKIQCQIDGGAFEDCGSPKTFNGLSETTHTVAFRAEDAAGNQDATPATRTFTVDLSQARCDAATARFNQAVQLRLQAKDDFEQAKDGLDRAQRRLDAAKASGDQSRISKARKRVRRARAAKEEAGEALDWATAIWRDARDKRAQACA